MNQVHFLTKNFGKYDTSSIGSYMNVGGFEALRKAVTMDPEEITDLLTAVKIKGRGGAEYPLGRKWSQARAVRGERKVVICNADEGETTTFKDRELICHDPFNLIEAMIIAAYVVGASDGFIYMRAEYACFRPLLLNAIRQAKNYGFLGTNILGRGFDFDIHLYSGAGAYVCGEGSALAESIGGHAGRPRMKPPFIKQCGVFHLPTCVNNVESLSLVAPLLLDDEGYYKSQGTPDCPGTKMISVCGNVKRPGVFEVPFGITIREIVYDLAGGMENEDYPLRLVQLGGASGRICSPAQLDTPYTYKGMRQADLTAIGSGAVLVVDERTSVIGFLRMTQEFFSHESCGQCTPCREGNRHISLLLDKVAEGTHTAQDIATLKKFADIMSSASLCGLGETAQSALLSCMKRFPEVFAVKEEVAVR